MITKVRQRVGSWKLKRIEVRPNLLLSPAAVVLIVSLVFIVINLYLTQHTRPFISDDVAWQTTFMTWNPFNGHVAFMGGKDNFIVNAPLIWLLGHIFSPTRALLLAEASIFVIFNFILFYIAGLYFLKKCKVRINYLSLLPFLWLASFGYDFTALFLNTYWRNFEVGTSFIFFMLAAMFYYKEVDPLKSRLSMLITALISLVAGVFIFSDPYFLFFTIGPITGLFVVLFLLKKVSGRQLLIALAAVLLSLFFAKAVKVAAFRIGLVVPAGGLSPSLINIHGLVTNMPLALKGLLIIFGASYFGLHTVSVAAAAVAVNLAMLTAILYVSFKSRLRRSDLRASPIKPIALWGTFFVVLSLFVFFVYTMTTLVGAGTYRYLVLLVFACVLLLALFSGSVKKYRPVFVAVLVAAISLNMLTSFHRAAAQWNGTANATNYAVIQTIKRLGLTKGYANYWDGNINTYLSKGSVQFLPVVCINSQTEPFSLLVDSTQFMRTSNRTFYVVDPEFDASTTPGCPEQQVIAQFGKPQQILHVLDKTILVYNHDLITNMQR